MAKVITAPDVAKQAADLITRAVDSLLAAQAQVVLAVAGGRSVVGTFERLARSTTIAWDRIHIFMVDERLVALNDSQSNFKLAQEKLITPLLARHALPKKNLHPFIYDPNATDAGLGVYEAELKKCGGRYDIILLGVGEDGHTAALFPNHHSIRNEAPYYLTMADSPKPPPRRMTASRSLLARAQYGVALFLDEPKRQALKNYQDQTLSVEACPVKIIDEVEHGYVVTDIQL